MATRAPHIENIEEWLAEQIWLAGFRRAFGKDPTCPWQEQSETLQEQHRDTARAVVKALDDVDRAIVTHDEIDGG